MNMAFCPCSIEHAPQAIVCTWCIPGGATLSKEKEQVIHIHHDLNHLSNLEDVMLLTANRAFLRRNTQSLGGNTANAGLLIKVLWNGEKQ